MDTLEDTAGHHAVKLPLVGTGHDVDILGTDNHIHRHVFAESLVNTLKLVPHERYLAVLYHGCVKNIALPYEICHKAVYRLVIDICRRAYLLYDAIVHNHHCVAQRKGLLLVVRDIYEGDAQRAVHLLELYLHILAHLVVQGAERFVKQQHRGTVHNSSGNRHTLLLATRKGVYVTPLVIGHSDHLQNTHNAGLNLVFWHPLQLQSEGDVVENIEMREKRIALENSVHRPFMWLHIIHQITADIQISLIGSLKARYYTQGRCFATTRRTQNGNELALLDAQANVIQNTFVTELLRDVFDGDDGVVFAHFIK